MGDIEENHNDTNNSVNLFEEEKKQIFKTLYENRNIINDDGTGEVTPLMQHNWELISRQLQVKGIQYNWMELRRFFTYLIREGYLDPSEFKHDDDDDESYSLEICSELINSYNNDSNVIPQSYPQSSTPKPHKTTNIVCNVTISPLATKDVHSRKRLCNGRDGVEVANKLVQTTLSPKKQVNTIPSVYYIDPNTGELKPVEVDDNFLIDIPDSTRMSQEIIQEHFPMKKRKRELLELEKNMLEQQTDQFLQQMELREKKFEMQMKLMEQQYQIGEINKEIAILHRDALTRQLNFTDL